MRRRAGELAPHVALRARDLHVRAGEREPRPGGVVEGRPRPAGRGVTGGAILREPGRDVVRVGGLLEGRQVAADAIGRGAGELAPHVALGADDLHVRTGQRELGFAVVERRPLSNEQSYDKWCSPAGIQP